MENNAPKLNHTQYLALLGNHIFVYIQQKNIFQEAAVLLTLIFLELCFIPFPYSRFPVIVIII